MLKDRREIAEKYRTDFDFRTLLGAAGAFFLTAIFACYNGFLGLYYHSLWNSSICVYYILLASIRAFIVLFERKARGPRGFSLESVKKTRKITSVILCMISLSLVVPVLLMLSHKRPVEMSFVPPVVIGAYTVYKIILASVNLKNKKKTEDPFVKKLRDINFIDALISILAFQNTLIIVNHKAGDNTALIFSVVSSFAVLVTIMAITARDVFKRW